MKQKLMRIAEYSGIVFLFGGFISGVARAQSAPVIVSDKNQLGTNLFCPIEAWMFWILMSLAVIIVMWAAYLYVTAGDDTEKVHRATKYLTYAAVAVIVALMAQGFPYLIESIFPSTTGQQTTSPLDCG